MYCVNQSSAETICSIAKRYDSGMRAVVALSQVDDVNEYVLGPIGAFFSSPGKRLRPVLCEAGCLLAGGRRESARNCALALESFHAAALIHDDIEDGAKTRRGSAALHETEGIPLAINAGDYGIALALGLILQDASLPDAAKIRVLEEFVAMAKQTARGQAMDIGWSRDGRTDISIEDCLLMVESKTASYSCATPLVIGGIIAGADRGDVDVLRSIGTKIGLAFQIRDDLDNLLSHGESGKDGGLDITKGKRTVIATHALVHSDEPKTLADILSSGTDDPRQIEHAVDIMKEAGSLAYAEDLVGRFCADARELLDETFSSGEGRDLVEEVLVMIEDGGPSGTA